MESVFASERCLCPILNSQSRMRMEGLKHDIEQTSETIKEYVKTEFALLKVELVEKSSWALASIISRAVLLALLILPIIFGLFALAFYLAEVYGSNAVGFGVVAAGITVLYIIGVVARRFLIVNPLQNFFINKFADLFFEDDADKERD